MPLRGFGRWPVLLLVFVALVAAGCGSSGPRVVRVHGTVTRGGKAVNKLFLNFYPAKGRPSWGVTDANGRYALHYDRDRDGALVGAHTVWVQVRPSSPTEEEQLRNGTLRLHPEIKAILGKYGNEKATPLKVQVRDEDNQTLDLQLD